MTNRHVITKTLIKLKQNIGISYDNLKKKFMLQLDANKRFIREFDYMNLDAIVIEILVSDNVNHKYFLSPFKNSIEYSNDKNNKTYTSPRKHKSLYSSWNTEYPHNIFH